MLKYVLFSAFLLSSATKTFTFHCIQMRILDTGVCFKVILQYPIKQAKHHVNFLKSVKNNRKKVLEIIFISGVILIKFLQIR